MIRQIPNRLTVVPTILLLLLVGSSPAFALMESPQPEQNLDILVALPDADAIPSFPRSGNADHVTGLDERLSGRWSIQENSTTGTAHLVWGSGTPLPAAANADAETLKRLAQGLINDLPEIFGVRPEHLSNTSIVRANGKSVVWFQQMHGGVPVEGARAHVLFHDSGRLMGMGSDLHPDVAVDTRPGLDRTSAIGLARTGLPFVTVNDEVIDSELLIVPLDLESGLEYRLAWRVVIQSKAEGRWNTLLDARDGSVLERRSETCGIDVIGNAAGIVNWSGYCDGNTPDVPFPAMEVNVVGGDMVLTDANGDFVIPYGGSSDILLRGRLRGPYVRVDRSPTGTVAEFSGVFTPGVPAQIYWNKASARADERNVFINANRIHDYLKFLDPDFTGLDYQVVCEVNRNSGLYAWFDGAGLHFDGEGGGLANAGEIGNVLFHEYAHIITQKLYQANGLGMPNVSVGEGNSDIAGMLMDLDSVTGRGYLLDDCSAGIRDADNTLIYPADFGGSGHANGQIISGVMWDAFEELRGRDPQSVIDARDIVARAWHFGRKLGAPQNFPDQVYWTFVADDDDGNLDNGTPHYDAFCVGATNHGFDCPEITVVSAVDENLPANSPVKLSQNFPNPFNPTTKIRFELAAPGRARLAVYDTRGRLVRLLANQQFAAGAQELTWDGRDELSRAVTSGVYFYRLEIGEQTLVKRMTMLK